MDKLVDDAMEAAGATKQATIGTAIHTLTEKHDRGEDLGVIPEDYVADIQAYADATKQFKNIFIHKRITYHCIIHNRTGDISIGIVHGNGQLGIL